MKLHSILRIALVAGMLTSCADSDNQEVTTKDPAVTHPPSEALPDTMTLVNDSVIVPENGPGSGR